MVLFFLLFPLYVPAEVVAFLAVLFHMCRLFLAENSLCTSFYFTVDDVYGVFFSLLSIPQATLPVILFGILQAIAFCTSYLLNAQQGDVNTPISCLLKSLIALNAKSSALLVIEFSLVSEEQRL